MGGNPNSTLQECYNILGFKFKKVGQKIKVRSHRKCRLRNADRVQTLEEFHDRVPSSKGKPCHRLTQVYAFSRPHALPLPNQPINTIKHRHTQNIKLKRHNKPLKQKINKIK